MTKLAVALLFLGVNFYTYYFLATDEVIPDRRVFAEFPLNLGEWGCKEREDLPADVLDNLGVTDWLICSYFRRDPAAMVGVYVGYHETQVRKEGGGSKENSIHPPEHCLPGSGWDVIDSSVVPLGVAGMPPTATRPEAKRFVIAKGNERQLVYFWYHSRGRVLARNHEVILYRFWDRARRNRTDGSLVRLTIPILRGDEERAERIFQEFSERFVSRLEDFVPS